MQPLLGGYCGQSLLCPAREPAPKVPRENWPRQFWCVTMVPTSAFQIASGRSIPPACV
jgi:hypothetical protein